jgi:NTE family protein
MRKPESVRRSAWNVPSLVDPAASSRWVDVGETLDAEGAVAIAEGGSRPRTTSLERSRKTAENSRRSATFFAVLASTLAGCAHYPENAPLASLDPTSGYRVRAGEGASADSTELAFAMTFSGGGTRAAAFAYGVLVALRDIEVEFDGRPRRLVNEIDGISSVSAGSVTAAYFGLHGMATFDTFPERFLYRNIQGALTRRFLAPWNWVRLVSPTFGRGDFMAEYFDDIMFDGATYADLLERSPPIIVVNATDIDAGTQFAFEQDQFDLLCSDIASLHVARAVAASSAVPLAFAPVTLKNYPSRQCGYELPAWAAADPPNGEVSSRRYQQGQRIRHYVQHDDVRFVHLVDGGISDNLGLRALYDMTTLAGGYVAFLESTGFTRFRRVLHLVVNAQKERSAEGAEEEGVPGPIETLRGITKISLDRYGFETVENIKRDLGGLIQDLKAVRCAPGAVPLQRGACDDVKQYFVELSFAQHPDPAERAYLMSLPTSFRLDPRDVDRIVAAAKTILDQSTVFREFLQDLAALDSSD